MTGGGSLLRNLDTLLTEETGIPCHLADQPMMCVALGTGIALEHFEVLRKVLVPIIGGSGGRPSRCSGRRPGPSASGRGRGSNGRC